MLNRRKLLALGGMAGGGALITLAGQAGFPAASPLHTQHSSSAGGPKPPVQPFTTRMPVPRELRPSYSTSSLDMYDITIKPSDVEMLPGLHTPLLTYSGDYVGPTIRAKTGRRALVRFRNDLSHGANVHLHGGHVAPQHDGYPTDLISPRARRVYEYSNRQNGATLWYHDHTHHREAEQVYRGLHGFYILEDEDERRFRLPSGKFDVPIMLSDAHFNTDGSLVWNPFGGWLDRTTLLANGRAQPYFPVSARRYRLRLLNAATHRHFRLKLDGLPMVQIAGDGGLLPRPVPRSEIVLSPGERADVIVDFGQLKPGRNVILNDETGSVLRFDVGHRAPDDSLLPDELQPVAAAPLAAAAVTRKVALSTDLVNVQSLINGQMFDPNRIDFKIRHGDTEIWQITNLDDAQGEHVDHNFHMHLVQFRILDRDGRPPAPHEQGLKDTVVVAPGETVRVQATFRGFRGRYVYHCHILEHSQFGMMGQFEVV